MYACITYFSTQESVKRFSYRQIPGWTTLTAKKVYEKDIFARQDILQFFSGEFKDYKSVKFPDVRDTLTQNLRFLDNFYRDFVAAIRCVENRC